MNNEFLMRRIIYSPCYVKIYCDIPIKFLQEVYFKSIIYLPNAIFNEKPFSNYEIKDDYIKIDIIEWSDFQNKIVNTFTGDNFPRISNLILKNLKQFEDMLEKPFKNKKLLAKDFEKLIEKMSMIDAYAVFNMYIPIDRIKENLNNQSAECKIEDLMICAFEPHRVQLKVAKLKLALKGIENLTESDYQDYYDNYAFCEEFEKWIFDTDKYTNRAYLQREIKQINRNFSKEEIQEKITTYENCRKKAINRAFECISKVDNVDNYSMLSIIVSEEEKRHILECKFLLLIGLTFKDIDIDLGRNSIYNMNYALEVTNA